MGLYESAKDALKEIPMADVIRERLSLALDRLAEADVDHRARDRVAERPAVESYARRDRDDGVRHGQWERGHARAPCRRRGCPSWPRCESGNCGNRFARTGESWLPFCPKCHLPISFSDHRTMPYCNDAACGWVAENTSMGAALQELRAMQYPSQRRG